MNNPERDELLSAYLDGHATPDEVQRVESDPELQARATAMAAAVTAVATPVETHSPAAVDAAIATALSESATAGNVSAIATRKPRTNHRTFAVAAAAAVIAIGFLAGAVLLTANDDSVDSSEVASSDPAADQDASSDNTADEAGQLTTRSQVELDSGGAESADAAAPAPQMAEAPEAEAAEEQAPEEPAPADEAPIESEAAADDAVADEEQATAADSQAGAAATFDMGAYGDIDDLLAQLDSGGTELQLTAEALPCGLAVPEPAPSRDPLGALATVGDTSVVVTGWLTPDGFDVDRIVDTATCDDVPLADR
jgi:hypothetical protein